MAGIPSGTRNADAWAYNWVKRLCAPDVLNTDVIRPTTLSPTQFQRECWLMAYATYWFSMNMRPRRNNTLSQGSTPGHISRAKPSSALLAVYGWRRILADAGCELVPMRMAIGHLKGLNALFKREFGAESLVPQHQLPLSRAQKLRMFQVLDSGEGLDDWPPLLRESFALMLAYAFSTGSRRDELTKRRPEDTCVMLAFFLWLHRDKLIPGCQEVWRCLIPGALLSGMSAASKADRDHIHWGNQRQWFSYQPGDPLSFAWRFLLYEQRHPRGSAKDAPAFSPDASDTPFGYNQAEALFKLVCEAAGIPDAATFHCARVTLACELCKMEQPDGTIQALGRWRSADSIRRYAALSHHQHASILAQASRTCAGSFSPDALPILDASDAAVNIAEAIDEIDPPAPQPIATTTLSDTAATPQSRAVPYPAPTGAAASPTKPLRSPRPPRGSPRGPRPAPIESVSQPPKTPTFKLGYPYGSVQGSHEDPLALMQSTIRIPNRLWPGYDDDPSSADAKVVGFSPAFKWLHLPPQDAYIVETGGYYYAFPASVISDLATPTATRDDAHTSPTRLRTASGSPSRANSSPDSQVARGAHGGFQAAPRARASPAPWGLI